LFLRRISPNFAISLTALEPILHVFEDILFQCKPFSERDNSNTVSYQTTTSTIPVFFVATFASSDGVEGDHINHTFFRDAATSAKFRYWTFPRIFQIKPDKKLLKLPTFYGSIRLLCHIFCLHGILFHCKHLSDLDTSIFPEDDFSLDSQTNSTTHHVSFFRAKFYNSASQHVTLRYWNCFLSQVYITQPDKKSWTILTFYGSPILLRGSHIYMITLNEKILKIWTPLENTSWLCHISGLFLQSDHIPDSRTPACDVSNFYATMNGSFCTVILVIPNSSDEVLHQGLQPKVQGQRPLVAEGVKLFSNTSLRYFARISSRTFMSHFSHEYLKRSTGLSKKNVLSRIYMFYAGQEPLRSLTSYGQILGKTLKNTNYVAISETTCKTTAPPPTTAGPRTAGPGESVLYWTSREKPGKHNVSNKFQWLIK